MKTYTRKQLLDAHTKSAKKLNIESGQGLNYRKWAEKEIDFILDSVEAENKFITAIEAREKAFENYKPSDLVVDILNEVKVYSENGEFNFTFKSNLGIHNNDVSFLSRKGFGIEKLKDCEFKIIW